MPAATAVSTVRSNMHTTLPYHDNERKAANATFFPDSGRAATRSAKYAMSRYPQEWQVSTGKYNWHLGVLSWDVAKGSRERLDGPATLLVYPSRLSMERVGSQSAQNLHLAVTLGVFFATKARGPAQFRLILQAPNELRYTLFAFAASF